MPTARHRYQITETDEVSRALDAAEKRWPGETRARLIVRLIAESGARVAEVNELAMRHRLAALDAIAGSFAEMYPPGYLGELRAEWPA